MNNTTYQYLSQNQEYISKSGSVEDHFLSHFGLRKRPEVEPMSWTQKLNPWARRKHQKLVDQHAADSEKAKYLLHAAGLVGGGAILGGIGHHMFGTNLSTRMVDPNGIPIPQGNPYGSHPSPYGPPPMGYYPPPMPGRYY